MNDIESLIEPYWKGRTGWWKVVKATIKACLGTGVVVGGLIFIRYYFLALQYDVNQIGVMPQRTSVLDNKGELIGRMHGENRVVVPFDEISPWFIKALLAREDARFYDHHGVDLRGLIRSMVRNIKDRRFVQGASTITMQLVRNSYVELDQKNLHRKILEIFLAWRIENHLSKEKILEHYCNRIFLGAGVYGIERAAQIYFGKAAKELDLNESATIAGLIRSPMRFSPFRNYDGAIKERNDVLTRMVITSAINEAEKNKIKAESLIVKAQSVSHFQGNAILDLVKKELDVILEEQEIEDGGLNVYTSIDNELQSFSEKTVEKRLQQIEKNSGYTHVSKAKFDASLTNRQGIESTPYLQAALTLLDNQNGAILAIVGTRDYQQSQYNRATQGERQVGSTVKPFVYAAAVNQGILPGSIIDDSPLLPNEIPDADPNWNPQNSDGQFLGPMTLTDALVKSRNMVTIRAGSLAKLPNVIELLKECGLGRSAPLNPQTLIGNLGGTPREVALAYSVFANRGIFRRGILIDKIVDSSGEIIFENRVLEVNVMKPGVAQLMDEMLYQVVQRGTAAVLKSEYGLKERCAGKTGTTNDYKDAWFVGYTPRLSAAVWVGLDKPQTIIGQGFGAKLALPIWADVIKEAIQKGYIEKQKRIPLPTNKVYVCKISGKLSTEACRHADFNYQAELPYDVIPHEFCNIDHAGFGSGKPLEQELIDDQPNPNQSSLLQRWFPWLR
jgi:penicillin-binding protein 1A